MAQFSLDEFVQAIQTAVVKSTDIAETHALNHIRQEEWWIDTGEKAGDGNPIYRPRMVTVRLPIWEEGKQVHKDIQVPMQTLVTGQSLAIDQMTVEMDVELEGMEDGADDGCEHRKLRINPAVGGNGWFAKKRNTAKISITFKGQEPPEGYARIDNQLIKLLP